MKVRSGFVSNSSSSSFVVAAVLVSDLNSTVDVRKEVQSCTTQMELDRLASEFYKDAVNYARYRDGEIGAEFWEFAYKQRFGSTVAVPSGFSSFSYDDKEYIGKQVGLSVEYGTVELNPDDITAAIAAVKKQFGVKNVKLLLTREDN
jgi:hypothetical protein